MILQGTTHSNKFYLCNRHMRVFACILSFYIMVLTALPCIDKPEDQTMQKTAISAKTSNGFQQDIDLCSPFCTCNCCSSPKIQQEVVTEFSCSRVIPVHYAENSPSFVSAPPAVVWQPPRFN